VRHRSWLTWGLLGPGKGIEWGIEAMAKLGDLRPAPRYIIAGQTHPKVMQRDGDTYIAGLRDQNFSSRARRVREPRWSYRDAAV